MLVSQLQPHAETSQTDDKLINNLAASCVIMNPLLLPMLAPPLRQFRCLCDRQALISAMPEDISNRCSPQAVNGRYLFIALLFYYSVLTTQSFYVTGVHSPIPAYSLTGLRDNAAGDLYSMTLNLEELIALPPYSFCPSLPVSTYLHASFSLQLNASLWPHQSVLPSHCPSQGPARYSLMGVSRT